MKRKELIEHIFEQDKEIFDLIARIVEIIHTHSLWGSEDEYVFKDGEIWHKFNPDEEYAKNVGKLTTRTEDNE